MMSSALQNVAVWLNTRVPDLSQTQVLPTFVDRPSSGPDALRRLNPRHRGQLLVAALRDGIETNLPCNQVAEVKSGDAILKIDIRKGNQDFWHKQLIDVFNFKGERGDRTAEFILQQSDILSFSGLAAPIGGQTHPMLMSLLAAVQTVVEGIEMPLKYHFNVRRPADASCHIHPVIQTPAHGSFPSGHSTESFATAAVLSHILFGEPSDVLTKVAHRIAENRTVAGVHYLADNYAGEVLGGFIAQHILHKLYGTDMPVSQLLQIKDGALTSSGGVPAITPNPHPVLTPPAAPAGDDVLASIRYLVAQELKVTGASQ